MIKDSIRYHVDKNHSPWGYLRLYRLFMNFYDIRGKELIKNRSRLALYFLKNISRNWGKVQKKKS